MRNSLLPRLSQVQRLLAGRPSDPGSWNPLLQTARASEANAVSASTSTITTKASPVPAGAKQPPTSSSKGTATSSPTGPLGINNPPATSHPSSQVPPPPGSQTRTTVISPTGAAPKPPGQLKPPATASPVTPASPASATGAAAAAAGSRKPTAGAPPPPQPPSPAATGSSGSNGGGSSGSSWMLPLLAVPAAAGAYYWYDQGGDLKQLKQLLRLESATDAAKAKQSAWEYRDDESKFQMATEDPSNSADGSHDALSNRLGGDGNGATAAAAGRGDPQQQLQQALEVQQQAGDGSQQDLEQQQATQQIDVAAIENLLQEVYRSGLLDMGSAPTAGAPQSSEPADGAPDAVGSSKDAAAQQQHRTEAQQQAEGDTAGAATATAGAGRRGGDGTDGEGSAATAILAAATVAAGEGQQLRSAAAAPNTPGLGKDLSPAGLVAAAIQGGEGAGEDWAGYSARHRQATADARAFAAALQQVEANHQKELEQVQAVAEDRAAAIKKLRRDATAMAEQFKSLMRRQREVLEEQHKVDVRRREQQILADVAQHSNAERLERSEVLDGIRTRLNALSSAFEQRSRQAVTSAGTHKVALGVLALERALEEGRPFHKELKVLQQACSDDPVVSAALSSLPPDAAKRGLPTHGQLQSHFKIVRREAKEMSYLPATVGGGGIIAHAVAKLAAALQVDEGCSSGGADGAVLLRSAEGGAEAQQPATPATVGGALSAAEHLLSAGRLHDAAAAVRAATQGSAAEGAVHQWVEAAAARARAEQAAKLLQAHATCVAASLA